MSNLDQDILDGLEPLSGIETVVLFGSRATGKARPDSDLDVAVLPCEDLPPEERLPLQLRVIRALADLAPEGRVDVVLIDEAPVVLRQRVMEHGRVLRGERSRAWRDLRVWTMKEYADTEPYRRLYRRKQKERLEKGERSGRSGFALESLERSGWLSR